MADNYLTPRYSAKIFLEMLIDRAYDGAISSMTLILEKGPSGRRPPEELTLLHRWFESLGTESQKYVQAVVRESVDSAVFGCLVLLDGMTGGYPIKGKLSDFALYLQTYQDSNAKKNDLPQEKVRLNPALGLDDLHDIFHSILKERTNHE